MAPLALLSLKVEERAKAATADMPVDIICYVCDVLFIKSWICLCVFCAEL